MKYHQGRFIPKNPQKYHGDPTNIVFRSSWERKVMIFFDMNPSVLKWSSEEHAIPYINPIDGRAHRYFPDFLVAVKTRDGIIKRLMVEVKPATQCEPPTQKKKTKRYIQEAQTYAVNQAKWEAARMWCVKNGFEFQILTETELGIK